MKPFASWQEYEEHIKSTSCQDVNGDFVSLFNESIQRQHVWPFEGKKMKERGVFCSPGLGVQRGIDNQHGEISTPGELSGG